MIRILTYAAAAVVGLVLLAGLAVAALLTWPRPAAEYLASHLLGRPVTMAEFSIGWQDPIRLSLRDLTIGNMPGASSPHMLSIASLQASIDREALLDGRLIYEQLRVERPRIALERDAMGRGNWEFGGDGGGRPSESENRLVLVPKSRRQFPTLLDFQLTQGELQLKTSSGKWIQLPLDDLKIQSAGEDTPVSLSFDGGYNDTDAQLSASTASFNAFRDADTPFEAGFSIITAGAKLDFKGVLAEPLDFEGVQGRLSLEARQLDDVIGVFDDPSGIAAPLKLAGAFTRDGDAWRLDGINGDIGGNRFEGRIALDEGARGQPDALQFHLDFDSLDLPGLLPQDNGKGRDWRSLKLRPATAPDTAHLDIQVGANTLTYASYKLREVTAAVEVEAGRIRLHGASTKIGAGYVSLSGLLSAGRGEQDMRLQGQMRLQQVEAHSLLQTLGIGSDAPLVAGSLDGIADLEIAGVTLGDAVKAGQGHAVLAMQRGHVARKLVEAASADLRAIFRNAANATALRCLLAVADLKAGRVALSPLALRSDGGTIRGAGHIDLAQQSIDLVVRSDPKTTGMLALDIPLQVSGKLDNISVKPQRNAVLPALPLPSLPSSQRTLLQGNPCFN